MHSIIFDYRICLLGATLEVILLHPSSICWQYKVVSLRESNPEPLNPEYLPLPFDQAATLSENPHLNHRILQRRLDWTQIKTAQSALYINTGIFLVWPHQLKFTKIQFIMLYSSNAFCTPKFNVMYTMYHFN